MELMIAGEDFDRFSSRVAEDSEVLDEVEEMAAIEHALEHSLELGHALRREAVAVDCSPGHEPLAVRGEGTNAGGDPVRGHQDSVDAKQRADLRLVGLSL